MTGEPFGLPEVVAVALAVRIVWSVAWIRFGRPSNSPPVADQENALSPRPSASHDSSL